MYKVIGTALSYPNSNKRSFVWGAYDVWYYDAPKEGTEMEYLPEIPPGYYYDIKVVDVSSS